MTDRMNDTSPGPSSRDAEATAVKLPTSAAGSTFEGSAGPEVAPFAPPKMPSLHDPELPPLSSGMERRAVYDPDGLDSPVGGAVVP